MISSLNARTGNHGGRTLRVGAVSYLNSKPLIEGFSTILPQAQLVLDVPSRLADELQKGRLDVALIPSIEAFSDPDYVVLSDACVAARGPVMSVKLYSRVHPGEIRTLALDEGSRTSACLTKVILSEQFGVSPKLELLPLDRDTRSTTADAIVLIGDRAMHKPAESFHTIWDLGAKWLEWTGLSFVFAMWVARQEIDLSGVASALSAIRDLGCLRIREIAGREAHDLQLLPHVAEHYLRHHLHFHLGPAERQGLKQFQGLASGMGLIPQNSQLHYWNSPPSPINRHVLMPG